MLKTTRVFFTHAFLFALMFLPLGCATTIGNRADPNETQFEIGVTHKTEVSNTLGLPQVRKSTAGHEYWGYPENAELVGLYLPIAATSEAVFMADLDFEAELRNAYVYVFDDKGILVHARKPQ